jgi:hypothetical protein
LFIKLDISKAFDTVNWPYMLSILTHLGFGPKWREWISALWCTDSSKVMLNREPGQRILHCRGVRQGDLLSPMLFLLAMEPIHMLFKKAQHDGMLAKLSPDCDAFRVYLYADDASIFINPTIADLHVTNFILQIFAAASGLNTNLPKTEYYPIRCEGIDMSFLTSFGQAFPTFPTTYLGLPLGIRKPSWVVMQTVVQKIGNRLLGWKRMFLTYPGRELLVKTILTSMPTYFLTVYKMPKWAIAGIDRFRRGFFWRGKTLKT